MIHWIAVLVAGLVTSFLLFPFNLPFATSLNTKMLVALFGLLFFGFDIIRKRSLSVSRDFLILSTICAFISIWAFFSVYYNGTGEVAFTTYILSVWVWLSGAYAVIWILRQLHESITVEIVGNYLVGVCTAQCVLAYSITISPTIKNIVDGMMGKGDLYMGVAEGRIYGLGAALDPAGMRFAAVLIILAYLISRTNFAKKGWLGFYYILAIVIITVIGNMISRSTMIGLALGLLYLILLSAWGKGMTNARAFWSISLPVILAGIWLCIWLYNVSPQFRSDLRFGFEGFFSLAEKGEWEVRSTNILKNMVVWPESVKTWIVGDGYFSSPHDVPDLLGRVFGGYYMHTDIGYLRYIFLFGVIGLAGMIAVFIQMTITCCKRLEGTASLFIFLLILNLIGWIKVSSDIIMVFAPFLILAYLSEPSESDDPKCESATSPSVEKKKERHLHQWQ